MKIGPKHTVIASSNFAISTSPAPIPQINTVEIMTAQARNNDANPEPL